VVLIAIALWLGADLAAAFDAVSIGEAKLRAVQGGYPCLVRGGVSMRLSTEQYYIQDETSGVLVNSPSYRLQEGDRLEVRGWIYLADGGEFQLRAAEVWYLGNGPPPTARLIAPADAYAGGYQGQLVAVRGTVLNVDFGDRFDTISIQRERTSTRVFYAANHGGLSVFERIYPGMQVAVTGVSVPQTADPEFDGYQVRLRGPSDLEIRPSPVAGVAAPRREWAGGMAALVFASAAVWIFSSRQRRGAHASQVQ
jgi:hypothetical protein